jgi:hypothetical protein
MKTAVVVAWHDRSQIERWLAEWGVEPSDGRLVLTHDANKAGCAVTKNRGLTAARRQGFERVIVLDDDCFPSKGTRDLAHFMSQHEAALEPQEVGMFDVITEPPSRGTPYFDRFVRMPVAASMGFWVGVGDYDAPGQLVHGPHRQMQFDRRTIFGRYFAMSGMNLAFDLSWWPWCQFIDVPRFDDIWMGLLWQKKAASVGACFNLAGPVVRHARQSNVWANLKDEARWLQQNEDLWKMIHVADQTDYDSLRALLPV